MADRDTPIHNKGTDSLSMQQQRGNGITTVKIKKSTNKESDKKEKKAGRNMKREDTDESN